MTGKKVKNDAAFERAYAGFEMKLSIPDASWNPAYTKMTLKVKCTDDAGTEMNGVYGLGQCNLLLEGESDWNKGILKEAYNLGKNSDGDSYSLPADSKKPGTLIIQNSKADVKFIEVVEVKFSVE